MSDNWVVQNLENALETWNEKLAEIWTLVTQSPQSFKGGSIWNVMVSIHGAVQAVGLALIVLFFFMGVMKTCGSFADLKRPEVAVKVFVRFALAKAAVTHGLELMNALFSIAQGLVSTIMSAAGFGSVQTAVLPTEIITAVEECGFFESIPLWAVTLIGGLLITVLSFVMITGNLHINLLENTNVFQVDKIPAGGETELTFRLGSDASIPAGKYNLNFTFNYDSSKILNLSSSGSTIVEIHQPANMELVMPRFSQSVTVGETIPLSLQVMNMGRDPMYNVRCTVSGYGFAPANTGYIGTMDAGSSATTEVELYIIALNASQGNENGSQYGDTIGTVTLIYEDETGQEYQQETQFETTVNRPVVEVPQTASGEDAEEKAAGQWWISVLILGGVILAAGIGFVLIKRKKKNRGGVYL